MRTKSTPITRLCDHCNAPVHTTVERLASGRGRYCSRGCASLARWARGFRPLPANKVTPLADRFWSKVNKDGPIPAHRPELGPCWVWTASRSKHGGYGQINVGASRPDFAHRVVWRLTYGALPADAVVCHHCDNPVCVRPAHLFIGTHAGNVADKVRKGRQQRGTAVPNARLTPEQIPAIRAALAAGTPPVEVAAAYGVSRATIHHIWKGKTWAWV